MAVAIDEHPINSLNICFRAILYQAGRELNLLDLGTDVLVD